MRGILRNISKSSAIFIAFATGVASAALVVSLILIFISTKYSIKQIEETTAIPIIPEEYFGEYAEVYIRDMTFLELLKEGKELADVGDDLTLNFLISRYDLRLSGNAGVFLTPAIRDLPLNEVFTDNGFNLIMNSVHIGEFRGYELREVDGESVWFDTRNDQPVKGINRVISSLTLAEALSGDFSFATLLDDLTFGEILGYTCTDGIYYDTKGEKVTGMIGVVCDCNINNVSERINGAELADVFGYENIDGVYYDKDGKKVTGIMSVICDTTITGVPDRVNSAKFSEILGYELDENGIYWDNGEKVTGVMSIIADCNITNAPQRIEDANMGEVLGYTFDPERGVWVDGTDQPVHVLMNKISSKKITQLDGITDELTLGDVINEENREGLVSFIPEDTKIDNIPEAVDDAFNDHSLKDFIEADVIQFTDKVDSDGNVVETAEQRKEAFLSKPVADYSIPQVIDFLYGMPDDLFN